MVKNKSNAHAQAEKDAKDEYGEADVLRHLRRALMTKIGRTATLMGIRVSRSLPATAAKNAKRFGL